MTRSLLLVIFCLTVVLALTEARGRSRGGHFSRMSGWGRRKHHRNKSHMRLICQVEGREDNEANFNVHTCHVGSECNVGPLTVNGTGVLQGKSFDVKFCNAVDSKGDLKVLSGACTILLSNGTVARNVTSKPRPRSRFMRRFMRKKAPQPCSVGPLRGNVTFRGEEAEAFFRLPPLLKKLMVKDEAKTDIRSRLKSFHEKFFGSKGWKSFFG